MQKKARFLALFGSLSFSAYATNRQHPHFNAFNALEQNILFQADAHLTKGNYPLQFWQDNQCFQAQSAVKLNQTVSLIPCSGDVPQLRLFKSADYQAQVKHGKVTFMPAKEANSLLLLEKCR
ncbi:hypothetical protein CFY87_08770 [Actinobacillus seminis]|uniref:Periplasmic alpha-amylase n=1 Tax=Actinobacillus seminis TaxID=722 RepID=A0A263HDC5_9PAST|nr:hypothetical protein [Actinobacillus seminis]OZN24536.1 hypothetical protein CFY87_08770 [Actinobacillus seminis]SUU38602.1 periplasmic alpha-amylase [Actinobacillus seminis]